MLARRTQQCRSARTSANDLTSSSLHLLLHLQDLLQAGAPTPNTFQLPRSTGCTARSRFNGKLLISFLGGVLMVTCFCKTHQVLCSNRIRSSEQQTKPFLVNRKFKTHRASKSSGPPRHNKRLEMTLSAPRLYTVRVFDGHSITLCLTSRVVLAHPCSLPQHRRPSSCSSKSNINT